MDVPPFLRSRPVPVRARHDGWTPVVQPRFILLLARGAGTDEATRRVGKSRQTAYALRKKAGAEAFAAAWDEALEFARLTREAAAAPRSEEHTSELQSLMRISYAVFCLKKKNNNHQQLHIYNKRDNIN